MTEEIIIDVSNCPHKCDDDCMEVPICNEYGDLMGYQSCEAQTLCPYRSQKKIDRLEQENKELKEETLQWKQIKDMANNNKYRSALEEIKDVVKEISYLGSRGERELKFKIKNILEDVIDKEVY